MHEGQGTTTREMTVEERLDHLFKYHAPTGDELLRYAAINDAAKDFARAVLRVTPKGADQSAAIRQIREARMTANAAIALDGVS